MSCISLSTLVLRFIWYLAKGAMFVLGFFASLTPSYSELLWKNGINFCMILFAHSVMVLGGQRRQNWVKIVWFRLIYVLVQEYVRVRQLWFSFKFLLGLFSFSWWVTWIGYFLGFYDVIWLIIVILSLDTIDTWRNCFQSIG